MFDIIWVMTRGGPANSTRTLSILVYQEAFSFQRAGSGASLALIVTLLVTVLAVAYAALMRKSAGASPDGTPSLTASIFIHACRPAACRRHPGAGRLAVRHEHFARRADLTAKPLHWWPRDDRSLALRRAAVVASKTAPAQAFVASLLNSIEVAGMATIAALIARHPLRLGRFAHAFGRLVALCGHRHLHAAAGGAGRAALYGACPGSRPPQQCLRPGAGLSHHPGALHHLADEVRLRLDPARDRKRGDDGWRPARSRPCG